MDITQYVIRNFHPHISKSYQIIISVLVCFACLSETRAVIAGVPEITEVPWAPNVTTPHVVQGEVFVKYKESVLQTDHPSQRIQQILKAEHSLKKHVFKHEPNVFSITTYVQLGAQLLQLPSDMSVEKAITELESDPAVAFAEPNYKIYPLFSSPPNDDLWVKGPIESWGLEKIGMPQAWKLSDGNVAMDVIVAVIDTGIDYTHPDLKSQIWSSKNTYGVNFCRGGRNKDPQDELPGHGTLLAGVIGAVHNTSHIPGINRHIRIMALKIMCTSAGTKLPEGDIADAIKAIEYAVENGATILNASWAYGNVPHRLLRLAIQEAGNANALFVAAAGNTGAGSPRNNNDVNPVYPASFGKDGVVNVLAVAGTMLKCASGVPPYSGACTDGSPPVENIDDQSNFGLKSVHMAAPGWATYSTARIHIDENPTGIAMGGGTSMAAAHVSGCAALLQAARRAKSPSIPLKAVDLKTILITQGQQLPTLTTMVKDGRRLNCFNALGTEIP